MNGYKFVDLTIHGKHYSVDKDKILQAANELKESGDTGKVNKYYVPIAGVNFPLARLLSKALDIMLIEINGQVAFRALTDLGFRILQREKETMESGEE